MSNRDRWIGPGWADGEPATDPAARRHTRQRAAVRKILHELDDFRAAGEIHSAMLDRGEQIGLSTVYRVLQLLTDLGEIDVLHSAAGESLYRLCGSEHHHHLMCRSCGRVVEVTGLAIESWADRVAAEHGYIDVAHSIEIFGTCAACTATIIRD